MSTYDDASLVMIPSGYKTGTVFSQKPMSTDGQLTFTRSNDTATRVASNGLIEKVRTNLVLQSNTFNTTWTNDNTSETSGQAGYDGTNNAWLLDSTGGFIYQNISLNGLHTFSVYAKKGTAEGIRLRINAGTDANCYINLNNGTEISVHSGVYLSVVSVGSGWYRIGLAINDSAIVDVRFYPVDLSGLSTTGNIVIQNAMLQSGDVMTDYIPTTTAAVSVGPVANVPRLDYLNSTCPKLLLEPQRTNLVTNSENISGSNWTNVDSTDSINVTATLDPSGYYGADKLQETTANSVHVIAFQTSLMSSANTYTFSSFLKAAERNWVAVYIYNGTSSFSAYFNLATGVKGSVTSSATSAIESYGNGWYRCSVTLAVAGSASANGGVITATADGTISYAGTAGSGIYVWGAQLEAAAYATSYIPTLGAAVTRGEDNTLKTSITSLIGQTEGTIFVEMDTQNISESVRIIELGNGAATNRIVLRFVSSAVSVIVTSSGVAQATFTSGALTNGNYKIALGYAANDFVLYINGTLRNSSASGSVPACPNLYLGYTPYTGSPLGGRVGQTLLFKTRLPNSELASLTTL